MVKKNINLSVLPSTIEIILKFFFLITQAILLKQKGIKSQELYNKLKKKQENRKVLRVFSPTFSGAKKN